MAIKMGMLPQIMGSRWHQLVHKHLFPKINLAKLTQMCLYKLQSFKQLCVAIRRGRSIDNYKMKCCSSINNISRKRSYLRRWSKVRSIMPMLQLNRKLFSISQLGQFIKVICVEDSVMVSEKWRGRTAHHTKVTGLRDLQMDRARLVIRMEIYTKESGRIINVLVMVNISTKMERHTLVTGKMIYKMDRE